MGKAKKKSKTDTKFVKKEVKAPTRGQRKRLDKKERLKAKKDFIEASKNKREVLLTRDVLSNFDSLKSSLEQASEQQQKKNVTVLRKKRKSQIERKDFKLFRKVIEFKPFQDDPLAVLKTHLENTIQLQKAAAAKDAKSRPKDEKKKTKKDAKKKGADAKKDIKKTKKKHKVKKVKLRKQRT